MKKPKRILLAGLVAAVLGGLLFLVLRPSEPSYQGEPLAFWLQAYTPGDYALTHPRGSAPPDGSAANKAVRAIGAKSIPILLRMLQQPDSPFTPTITRLVQRQHFIRIPFAPADRNVKAFRGFLTLGSEAGNAVPRLIEIFERDPSPFSQEAVPVILSNIGPAAAPAIPALIRGIDRTNEIARNNAISALGQIHAEPALVVPALIKCLNDPDSLIRAQAAYSLGKIGAAAHSAIPALLQLLRREALVPASGSGCYIVIDVGSWRSLVCSLSGGQSLLGVIKDALRAIDPDALAKAGVQ